jgi:putative oxidoreductase
MKRVLENMQPFALLVLRATLGLVMTSYGWLKVTAGMAEFKAFVVTIGFPGWMGYLAAYGELLGGILLIVGLLTRFSGLTILIIMTVAIAKVTWKNGLTGPQGFGFPLALAAMAFLLIFFGGGPISLDSAIFGGAKKGPGK